MEPISEAVIAYLKLLLESNGRDNEEQLRTVVFFFDNQDPRTYHRPGMANVEVIPSGNIRRPATRIDRVDEAMSIVFQRNPTCSWKIINGQHRLYCG
jgi:hypothetical protein